jgi:very-short-patch-repair endonuclease
MSTENRTSVEHSHLFKKGVATADESLLSRYETLKEHARELRRNATRQENHLWYDFLKKQNPRWTRQRVVGVYIVDFFCFERGLVVELDGGQHYEKDAIVYDSERTRYLKGLNLEVLRFSNYDIDTNFEGVCKAIETAINPRQADACHPLREGGFKGNRVASVE